MPVLHDSENDSDLSSDHGPPAGNLSEDEDGNLNEDNTSKCIPLSIDGIFSNGALGSLYNDGKGIQISATLIGVLPPLKAGEKHHANAKPLTTTKVVYIHEDSRFTWGLSDIIAYALGHCDLCQGGIDVDGRLLLRTSKLFLLAFTIPCSASFKDVEMLSEDDWKTFLGEAAKKPCAHGKLVITEKGVSIVLCAPLNFDYEIHSRILRQQL